jgi:polyferredoxin
MEKTKDTGNNVVKKVAGFLSDKPLWVWWLFYLALTGVLFGISNLAIYFLGIQVWIGVLVLILFGLIWGTVNYYKLKGRIKTAKRKTR